MDRLVGGDMHVGGVRVELPARDVRDVRELLGFGGGDDIALAVLADLLDRLLAPIAGEHEVSCGLPAQEVLRNDAELRRRAALHEQHLVVGRHAHHLAQILFGLLGDAHELLVAMAHLHHAHAGAAPVEQLLLHLLEDGFGQRGGAGAEVEDSGHRVFLD